MTAPPIAPPDPLIGRPRAPTPAPAEHAVRQALRDLLLRIGPVALLSADDEVVLCIEVDGIRYTLTHQRAPADRPPVALSAREREIARLISAGHTNKTVAAILEISLWTVDTHIRRIFAKLGVRSRSAMVARLAESGLLATEST